MLAEDRLNAIVSMVQQAGSVTVPELADALATLDRYNFNCGFWGSNGIAAEQGFTTPDIEEAQVKRISMRHTAKRFVISDASKFGMVAPVKFADFRDATIITAGEVPAKYQSMDNVITV